MKPITDLKFQIPGKTFLVGEYAVLVGGTALGLATTPCFEFTFGGGASAFHPESPAGKYFSSRGEMQALQFTDPYQERGIQGGFGRSTAEYLAAITTDLLEKKISVFEILNTYRNLTASGTTRPSGMDLVFQFLGGITLADQQLQMFQNFDWNFPNLDFFLISSGVKIQTHTHLESLKLDSLLDLPELSATVANFFVQNNETEFLYHMNSWCELLKSKKLTHANSLEIRTQLESTEVIKLVKPCGALGADVLAVFFDRADQNQVKKILVDQKYSVCAGSDDLSAGLVSQLRPYWSQHVG